MKKNIVFLLMVCCMMSVYAQQKQIYHSEKIESVMLHSKYFDFP